MKIIIYGLVVMSLFCSPASAGSADVAGHIRTLSGSVSIVRGDATLPGSVGALLYRFDLVRTAKPGAAGIVLTDDTTISLGPNSELSLDEYAFDPKEGKFSLAVRMARGTFIYLSGLIGKLSPNSVKLTIPDATIAVRGTKLLVDVQE